MREVDVGNYRNRYRKKKHLRMFRPAVSAPQLGGEPPISEEVSIYLTKFIVPDYSCVIIIALHVHLIQDSSDDSSSTSSDS